MNIGKLVLRKPDDRAPADSSTLPKALDHRPAPPRPAPFCPAPPRPTPPRLASPRPTLPLGSLGLSRIDPGPGHESWIFDVRAAPGAR